MHWAKRYDFLTVEKSLKLFPPKLRVMARLFIFREFAAIVDEFEGLDVALEDDFKLLEQTLSGFLFLVQSNVLIATCICSSHW